MYEKYLPQKEKNLTLEQASLLEQGWTGALQRGCWRRVGGGVHMLEGAGSWHSGSWVVGLILCNSGLWSDLWEHTSPSWLALLTPCHILANLRNSLFLFELIRTKTRKKKKRFSPWDLGKGRGGGMSTWSSGAVLSQAMQPLNPPHSCVRGSPAIRGAGCSFMCCMEVVFWSRGVSFCRDGTGRGAWGGLTKKWEIEWLRGDSSGR